MATPNNTIKTRIQSKSDIETNWNKLGPKNGSAGFIPLNGEIIVYAPDDTHTYSRLKIGDGQTNIVDLPFIDAASLNGNDEIIRKYNSYNSFPNTGSSECLYLDKSNNQLYHYDVSQGYTAITVYITTTTSIVTKINSWKQGSPTIASIQNNILTISNGEKPELFSSPVNVVTGVYTR